MRAGALATGRDGKVRGWSERTDERAAARHPGFPSAPRAFVGRVLAPVQTPADFLARWHYAGLFAVILAEEAGVPLPLAVKTHGPPRK